MKWLAAILLAAVSTAPQDLADSPFSWTQFKAGTTRKVRMTMSGGTTETRLTLKEVTEKEAVLDMVMTSKDDKEGKASVLRMSRFRLEDATSAEETLKFKGVEYKCRVKNGTYEQSGMRVEGRYWVSDGVGLPLKIVEVSTGNAAWMNLQMESLLVSLDEDLTIAGRKLKCAKYQGTTKGMGNGTVTQWLSAEIPGGLARNETEILQDGVKSKLVMETIEFEVKK